MPRVSFDQKTWMDVSTARLESLAALPGVDCYVDLGEPGDERINTLDRHRKGLPWRISPEERLFGRPIVFVDYQPWVADPTISPYAEFNDRPTKDASGVTMR